MLEIRSPAVERVWRYALELGVPPDLHLARWVEATALVRKGKDPEATRGEVRKLEIIMEGEIPVGVIAHV